jgi:2-polyprenyl-3-methyl-5-hydroxy-6-metoxy-1,4-benzoquinol methylase
MAHSVKHHLDVDADAYDVQIRRFIPHYDEMLATGVELLATLAPPGAHVLDLGGGTGALSAAVLDGLPQAHVTVLDVDRTMLDEAQRRLAPFGERAEFREASFLDPLPAADAVVASLALHHVRDLDAKTDLYRAIHAALTAGGVFLNLDSAITEDPRLNALTFDRWAADVAEQGIMDAPLVLSGAGVAANLRRTHGRAVRAHGRRRLPTRTTDHVRRPTGRKPSPNSKREPPSASWPYGPDHCPTVTCAGPGPDGRIPPSRGRSMGSHPRRKVPQPGRDRETAHSLPRRQSRF